MLHVRAFGSVGADLDDVTLDLGGPRQRAVLGVLVAAGRRTVSADRFLHELWNGEPPPSASGALQAYISRLRGALEPQRQKRRPATVLVSAPPGYALALPDEAVDTWQFAALVRGAPGLDDDRSLQQLDRALALWTDTPFVEYLDQEWAATEAARLADLHADAVEMRATVALRLGADDRVVADLEAHVRAHPMREQAVALLARALYRGGRQAEALTVLADVRTRLVEELGVDPGEALRELESDILNQAQHLRAPAPAILAPAPATVPVAPVPVAEPVIVGREDELARLAAAADSLMSRPGLVWVESDAGFGKSALVSHFCDESVLQWSVARGRCSEVAGAPAGIAWVDVLRDLTGAAAGVAPIGGPGHPDAAAPYALADEVRRRLEERGTRTLIALEDVHRADDETLQVLRHVVESTRAPVLVVATFRSHEVGRDLAATLALTTERTLDRIHLSGLGAHEARALLARHLTDDLPAETWQRLLDRSAGNPLFLRQLGRLVEAEGAAAATDGIPTAIRDLLTRRIERLPMATVDTLSRASVLGREIDFDLLLALEQEWGEADEDAVADHLDAGLVAGLLDSPRPAELQFTHALIRETFYARLAPLRRHRLHRAAMTVLERDQPHRVDEIAHHATASLDRRSAAKAVPRLLAAAARSSAHSAVPHLRSALRAIELAGRPWPEDHRVRLDLVRALAVDGDLAAAREERERAVALATRHGSDADVARAWQWQAPLMWSRRPSDQPDQRLLDELHALLERIGHDDVPLRIELLCALVIEADPWNVPVVVAAGIEALDLAEDHGDPELLCRALNARFFGTFAEPDAALLTRLGVTMLETAEAAGLHGYVAMARTILQSEAVGRAELAEAAEHVDAATAAGTNGQLPELLMLAAIFESTEALLSGDIDAARSGFAEVCRQIRIGGDPNARYIELWTSFAVEFVAGDCSGLLDQARAMAETMTWHSNDLYVCALLDAGERDRARAEWHPATMQRDATWLFDIAVRAHLVAELEDGDRAREVYEQLLPWSGRLTHTLNGALSMGPVDHYLGRLAALLGDSASAARHFELAQRLTGPGMASAFDRTWVRTPDHLRR